MSGRKVGPILCRGSHSILSCGKRAVSTGGYKQDVDYYYFCDCVLRQEEDYYEDAHGNKIIGNYQGLKFAFSGFRSVIKIGKGVQFREAGIYLHNGAEVVLGSGGRYQESTICLHNGTKLTIGEGVRLEECHLTLNHFSHFTIAEDVLLKENYTSAGERSVCKINRGCQLVPLHMVIGKKQKSCWGKKCM